MTIETIRNSMPDYAKDTKLNLGSILSAENSGLTQKQVYGSALAAAYATKEPGLIRAVVHEVSSTLSAADIEGAKGAAALMAMNNIYYHSLELIEDKEYRKLPANLRMNIMRDPGIDKVDFELYSVAVSAVYGCGMCLNAHVEGLTKHGLSRQAIQTALRIAAVIHATAQVLVIEETSFNAVMQAA